MKIGMLQINPVVGDIEGNLAKILLAYQKICEQSLDFVVASELVATGYPPKDLLLQEGFVERQNVLLKELSSKITKVPLLLGCVEINKGGGQPFFNSVAYLYRAKVMHIAHKTLLPNYDVFDERRYFEPANQGNCFFLRGQNNEKIAVLICEDIWGEEGGCSNPLDSMVLNVDLLITLNASPYYRGKEKFRYDLLEKVAKKINAPVVYVNQVGGNDELIFDGRSFAVNSDGQCIACAKTFAEDAVVVDTKFKGEVNYNFGRGLDDVFEALVLGTRDYAHKCGFQKAVIGLSGGIDSALVAVIAQKALGAENVLCVGMPSEFSSHDSLVDARELAENLGVEFKVIPITDTYHSYEKALETEFSWHEPGTIEGDVSEENIQARIRGNYLMYISNKLGYLLLSTGNKSEMAVGYCTLYGDMSGGLAVISDMPKTMVFELARYINRDGEIIPWNTINKPPSAELSPNQKDSDSLPDYGVLDRILEAYIVDKESVEEIVRVGYDQELVEKIVGMVNRNEYKRKQAPPGLKVTETAFGSGRRMPIAAKF